MYMPLSNSYEWSILNKGGQATDKVAAAIKSGTQVMPSDMQIVFSKLRNRLKSPLMTKISEAITNGSIQMVYTPETLRIPLYLPFILVGDPGTKKTTGLVTHEDDGSYNCDEYKLKASLESCFMALKFVELQNSPKLVAPNIVRPASKIYSFIIAECINRKHSIKLDPDTFNQVLFIASKFYTNIATVLQKLAQIPELKNRLGNLTVSNFMESYINIYDASMLLALENFSYFNYNIISVLNSTYVNNYHILKQIVGKDGQSLYAALITGVCGI